MVAVLTVKDTLHDRLLGARLAHLGHARRPQPDTPETQDKSSPEKRHTMMRRSPHRVLKRPDLAAVWTASAAASSVTKYPSE